MQCAKRIVSVIVCLFAIGASKQEPAVNADLPSGAWLLTKLKWRTLPQISILKRKPGYDPVLQGRSHVRHAGVRLESSPGKYISINDEDGLGLWRGQWTADRKGITVWYEFVVPRRKHRPGGPLSRPAIERANIRRSHDLLTFTGMKFER